MEVGKVPPHDLEAEQAVIGSMLTDKEAVISAIEVLKEEDFYRDDNKTIYGAILNLYNSSEPIDIITLKAELTSLGKLEAVGGLEYLAELPEKVKCERAGNRKAKCRHRSFRGTGEEYRYFQTGRI